MEKKVTFWIIFFLMYHNVLCDVGNLNKIVSVADPDLGSGAFLTPSPRNTGRV
jgi:hypothetical protein